MFCCTYETKPDLILFGGQIVTCSPNGEPENPPTALAVAKGYICAVGQDDDILALATPETRVVSLKGNTIAPGFIDPHSHLNNCVLVQNWADVSPPPVGKVKNVQDLIKVMKAHLETPEGKIGKYMFAYGYDENYMGLPGNRHLTAQELDAHFPDRAVIVLHNSNHGIICNSKALAELGIDADWEVPTGGTVTKDDNGVLTGGVWEAALIKNMHIFVNSDTGIDGQVADLHRAQLRYAANGYTTIQEGLTTSHLCHTLLEAAKRDKIFLDIVALPSFKEINPLLEDLTFGSYFKKLKFGGVKFVMDGSPQAKTAWLTKPNACGANGEPTVPVETFNTLVKKVVDSNVQCYCHCNGDATIDAFINALELAGVKEGDETRHVVVHAQVTRPDHIPLYKKYNLVPSYFTNHCYYHGDTHRKNLGSERAAFISPCKSTEEAGVKYTNHTDFTITPLDPMMTVWTAVSRTSRSGIPVGLTERITPLQALMAITYNAAYQYHEEALKGSIEEGKLADLVVLSKNPLTVPVDSIKDIKIQMTFKDGVEVYNRKKNPKQIK